MARDYDDGRLIIRSVAVPLKRDLNRLAKWAFWSR